MAKWRDKLAEVDDPVKLGSRTFAVVASYVEKLGRIFGLIIDRQEKRELRTNVNVDFDANLTVEQRLAKARLMQRI